LAVSGRVYFGAISGFLEIEQAFSGQKWAKIDGVFEGVSSGNSVSGSLEGTCGCG
jgi:hypothetical protein